MSGIPVILGLGRRIWDPYVYVVFLAPRVQGPNIGILKAVMFEIFLLPA